MKAMRATYISALLVILVLAAPLWAGQRERVGGGVPRRESIPRFAPRRQMPAQQFRRTQPPVVRNPVPGPRPVYPAQSLTAQTAAAPRPAQSVPHQIIRGQGPHNGDWLRDTMRLPPQEQQRKLQQDQRFQQLPPQRQEQLRNRLQSFNSLPPQQQQRVLNRMEMIEHLRPEQQRQAQALFGQFRGMDPQRKEMMRRALHQMRGMPPDARERMLNSPEIQSRYTPQEVQMLRGFNDIGFAGPQP